MASPESSSKLNLFKFVSKRKSTGHTTASPPVESDDPKFQNEGVYSHSDIDNPETDDSYPPESFYNQEGPLESAVLNRTPSEASLIFERNVEDPSLVLNSCPRCGGKSTNGQVKCNHQSIVNLPTHYSLENYVSPCLDASAKILTDKSNDLDNIDMVYSRRPSTVMGLEAALGRTRSFSSTSNAQSPTSPSTQRTQSFADIQDLNSNPSRPQILSFYSYADVINNENPNPRRPSITQSLSSSFLSSPRSNSFVQNSYSNSITPHRNPTTRPSFSSPFIPQQLLSKTPRESRKFSLNSDTSPNSSDSESDFNPLSLKKTTSSRHSISSKKSSQSKKPTLPNINTTPNLTPLKKTYSSQSSLASGTSRRYANLDGIDDVSDSESFVVSSIGDELRKNTGEIKSN